MEDDDRPSIADGRVVGEAMLPIGILLGLVAIAAAIRLLGEHCMVPGTHNTRSAYTTVVTTNFDDYGTNSVAFGWRVVVDYSPTYDRDHDRLREAVDDFRRLAAEELERIKGAGFPPGRLPALPELRISERAHETTIIRCARRDMFLHARQSQQRQSTPARSRRKLRTWET